MMRDLAVIGEQDRERGESGDRNCGRGDVDAARQLGLRRDIVAKQRADRHVMRAAERPQRKGERGHQAVKHAPAQARPAATARTIGSGMIAPNRPTTA